MNSEVHKSTYQPPSFLGSKNFINYSLQLLLVLAVIGYFIYVIMKPDALSAPDRSKWNNREGFWSISYKGVVKKPDGINITKEKLTSHIEALKKAGFNTITSQDLFNFLYNDKTLPSNALYLIFENGRKDTVLNGSPILKSAGYNASLYILGHKVDSWNKFFLRKDSLKRIDKSPYWSLHSKGYRANELIKTGTEKDNGHYLTNRMWLKKKGNLESNKDFYKRVSGDYENAFMQLSDLKRNNDVIGYIYPFSDRGDQHDADPVSLNWNERLVKKYFKFSFVSNNYPYNAYGINPYSLQYLSINPDINGEDLEAELLSFLPKWGVHRYKILAEDIDGFIRDWYSTEGEFSVSNGKLYHRPGKENKRATFWLKGSENIEDVIVKLELRTKSDDILRSFFLRYENPSSYIKLNIDKRKISILQKHGGDLVKTAEKSISIGGRDRVTLKLMIKKNRLFVWLDDEYVFLSPVYVFPDIKRGAIGVSFTYDKGGIPFESPFSNITFKSLPEIWLIGKDLDDINRNYLSYIKTVSPPFNDITGKWRASPEIARFNILAKFYGIQLMPTILLNRLNSKEFLDTLSLKKEGLDGITVMVDGELKSEGIEELRKGLAKIKQLSLGKVALSIDSLMLATLLEESHSDIINKVDKIILFPAKSIPTTDVQDILMRFSRRFDSKKIVIAFEAGNLERISMEGLKRPLAEGAGLYEEEILDRTIQILREYKDTLNIFLDGLSFT